MKNQYFGDINDYRKYGLLRALQGGGEYKLLVAWMLTPDVGGTHGGFRSYLQSPEEWGHFDPKLYSGITELLQSSSSPQVSLLEGCDLLPRTTFYSALVPDPRSERDHWRKGLMASAFGVDLVFFDPDNGIEVPSKPVGRKGSSKYVAWQEIEGIWEAGCSLLIYQHFRHERHEDFVERMVAELRGRTGARFTQAFLTSHVLFLLVAQEQHKTRFRNAISGSLQRWKGQIEAIRWEGNEGCHDEEEGEADLPLLSLCGPQPRLLPHLGRPVPGPLARVGSLVPGCLNASLVVGSPGWPEPHRLEVLNSAGLGGLVRGGHRGGLPL